MPLCNVDNVFLFLFFFSSWHLLNSHRLPSSPTAPVSPEHPLGPPSTCRAHPPFPWVSSAVPEVHPPAKWSKREEHRNVKQCTIILVFWSLHCWKSVWGENICNHDRKFTKGRGLDRGSGVCFCRGCMSSMSVEVISGTVASSHSPKTSI